MKHRKTWMNVMFLLKYFMNLPNLRVLFYGLPTLLLHFYELLGMKVPKVLERYGILY